MSDVLDEADDDERADGSSVNGLGANGAGVIQSVVTAAQIIEALAAAEQPVRLPRWRSNSANRSRKCIAT